MPQESNSPGASSARPSERRQALTEEPSPKLMIGVKVVSNAAGAFAMAGLPHGDLQSPLQLEGRLIVSKPGLQVVSVEVFGFVSYMR